MSQIFLFYIPSMLNLSCLYLVVDEPELEPEVDTGPEQEEILKPPTPGKLADCVLLYLLL